MLWISEDPNSFFQDPEERAGCAKQLIQPGWETIPSNPLPMASCSASHISKGCQPPCFLGEPSIPQLRHEAIPLLPNPWKQRDSKDDTGLPQEGDSKKPLERSKLLFRHFMAGTELKSYQSSSPDGT